MCWIRLSIFPPGLMRVRKHDQMYIWTPRYSGTHKNVEYENETKALVLNSLMNINTSIVQYIQTHFTYFDDFQAPKLLPQLFLLNNIKNI